jgi:hypothetical protein
MREEKCYPAILDYQLFSIRHDGLKKLTEVGTTQSDILALPSERHPNLFYEHHHLTT